MLVQARPSSLALRHVANYPLARTIVSTPEVIKFVMEERINPATLEHEDSPSTPKASQFTSGYFPPGVTSSSTVSPEHVVTATPLNTPPLLPPSRVSTLIAEHKAMPTRSLCRPRSATISSIRLRIQAPTAASVSVPDPLRTPTQERVNMALRVNSRSSVALFQPVFSPSEDINPEKQSVDSSTSDSPVRSRSLSFQTPSPVARRQALFKANIGTIEPMGNVPSDKYTLGKRRKGTPGVSGTVREEYGF